MRALWRFAVEAKWVDEALPGPAWTIVPVCKDIGETNMRMVREFLTTTGMSLDDQKFGNCGVVPFTSVQSMLSSPSLRSLNPHETHVLFTAVPHQTLHHNDRGHSYYLHGQGHFLVGIAKSFEVRVAYLLGGYDASIIHNLLFPMGGRLAGRPRAGRPRALVSTKIVPNGRSPRRPAKSRPAKSALFIINALPLVTPGWRRHHFHVEVVHRQRLVG